MKTTNHPNDRCRERLSRADVLAHNLAAHELARASEGADELQLELLDELRGLCLGMTPLYTSPLWVWDDGTSRSVYTEAEVERAVAAVAADLLREQIEADEAGDLDYGESVYQRLCDEADWLWCSECDRSAQALIDALQPHGQDAIAEALEALGLGDDE